MVLDDCDDDDEVGAAAGVWSKSAAAAAATMAHHTPTHSATPPPPPPLPSSLPLFTRCSPVRCRCIAGVEVCVCVCGVRVLATTTPLWRGRLSVCLSFEAASVCAYVYCSNVDREQAIDIANDRDACPLARESRPRP